MATVIIRPTSDVYRGGCTDQDGGTSNLYSVIDETVLYTGDYIKSPSGISLFIRFNFSSSGLTNETINKITFNFYVNNKSTSRGLVYLNSTNYYTDISSQSTTDPEFVSLELEKNPYTESAWTVSDINSIDAGVSMTEGSKHTNKVYQLWIEVDYISATQKPLPTFFRP
jgi:hypothetical protein